MEWVREADSEGYWAFEGRMRPSRTLKYREDDRKVEEVEARFIREVKLVRRKYRDLDDDLQLCVINWNHFTPLPVSYFNGRWWKVIPPWQLLVNILEEPQEEYIEF